MLDVRQFVFVVALFCLFGFQYCHVAGGGGDGLSLPAELEDLFNPPYASGVRVHSNSWGYVRMSQSRKFKGNPASDSSLVASCASSGQECNLYDAQAQQIDR